MIGAKAKQHLIFGIGCNQYRSLALGLPGLGKELIDVLPVTDILPIIMLRFHQRRVDIYPHNQQFGAVNPPRQENIVMQLAAKPVSHQSAIAELLQNLRDLGVNAEGID